MRYATGSRHARAAQPRRCCASSQSVPDTALEGSKRPDRGLGPVRACGLPSPPVPFLFPPAPSRHGWRGHGFPRSHGPAEAIVNRRAVTIRLTLGMPKRRAAPPPAPPASAAGSTRPRLPSPSGSARPSIRCATGSRADGRRRDPRGRCCRSSTAPGIALAALDRARTSGHSDRRPTGPESTLLSLPANAPWRSIAVNRERSRSATPFAAAWRIQARVPASGRIFQDKLVINRHDPASFSPWTCRLMLQIRRFPRSRGDTSRYSLRQMVMSIKYEPTGDDQIYPRSS